MCRCAIRAWQSGKCDTAERHNSREKGSRRCWLAALQCERECVRVSVCAKKGVGFGLKPTGTGATFSSPFSDPPRSLPGRLLEWCLSAPPSEACRFQPQGSAASGQRYLRHTATRTAQSGVQHHQSDSPRRRLHPPSHSITLIPHPSHTHTHTMVSLHAAFAAHANQLQRRARHDPEADCSF